MRMGFQAWRTWRLPFIGTRLLGVLQPLPALHLYIIAEQNHPCKSSSCGDFICDRLTYTC